MTEWDGRFSPSVELEKKASICPVPVTVSLGRLHDTRIL